MELFLSYCFKDEPFVRSVNYFLTQQPNLDTFCYAEDKTGDSWTDLVERKLQSCDAFALFLGEEMGRTQKEEAVSAFNAKKNRLLIALPEAGPNRPVTFSSVDPIKVEVADAASAQLCAAEIVKRLGLRWVSSDGLPIGYPFDYEKDIIEAYIKGNGRLTGEKLERGCAEEWPRVEKRLGLHESYKPNPVPEKIIGTYRPEGKEIIVDVRTTYQPGPEEPQAPVVHHRLTLPEAGPRAQLRYPVRGSLTVGILVSGGIAPGINAVIAGIVGRHALYATAPNDRGSRYPRPAYQLTIRGYVEGFKALLLPGHNYRSLSEEEVKEKAHLGGSILGTSRADELLSEDPYAREAHLRTMVNALVHDGVEILYIIGGHGSMRAALALSNMAKDMARKGDIRGDLSVVAIPKTMDNDILWVWQSFGFMSAVDKAREAILNLHTEVTSNPRLCIIQLFGSDSGFVVSHAALASGSCDAALIPEVDFTLKGLSGYIREKLANRYVPGEGRQSPYGIVVMAETAIPTDALEYVDDADVQLSETEKTAIREFMANRRRVEGQTPDAIRTAGLKILSRVLQRDIVGMSNSDPYWRDFRVFTNEPRHILRATPPSVSDVVFGQRLGALAVDNAMAGYTDFMVSQWLTEYVLVPLQLVVLGRKRVPRDGIFWKSVLANTGQRAEM